VFHSSLAIASWPQSRRNLFTCRMFEKASIYKFYIQCNISTLFSCLCKIQRLYPILNIELRCVLYYILPRYRIAMVYILIKMLFRTIIRCYALYSLFSLADLTIFVLSFFFCVKQQVCSAWTDLDILRFRERKLCICVFSRSNGDIIVAIY